MDWLNAFLYGDKEEDDNEDNWSNISQFNEIYENFGDLTDSIRGSSQTIKGNYTNKSDSSKEEIYDIAPYGWQFSEYDPPFQYKRRDFAQCEFNYDPPLLIRFYEGATGARAQIGGFENVLMTEIVDCFRRQKLAASNLVLIIHDLTVETFVYYEEGLLRILPVLSSQNGGVRRCVIWADKFCHVNMFADIFSRYCNNLLELNIGGSRRVDIPLKHPPPDFDAESCGVIALLEVLLVSNAATLRCLRFYNFIDFDEELARIINLCPNLSHITLSKAIKFLVTNEFSTIRTFELDKQSLGYTDDDIQLFKRLLIVFPKLYKIRVIGNQFSPLLEMLLIRLSSSANRKFEVFQGESIPDIMKHIEKVCSRTCMMSDYYYHDDNQEEDPPTCVILKNHNSKVYVFVHGNTKTSGTPML